MRKKYAILFVLVLSILLSTLTAFANDTIIFDKSELASGLIRVNCDTEDDKNLKFSVQKDNQTYTYDLLQGDTFPLQLGNGQYKVTVLKNIEGNKYKIIANDTVELKLENQNDLFLKSIKMVNWNSDMDAIKKAKELTKNSKTDTEKVSAIYNYVISNLSYDYEKLKTLGTKYIPAINDIYSSNKGICYDYSSLFAGMLRSINVSTKLVMGYKNDIKEYHAWNQVYLKDQGKWITIDTTYDSTMKHNAKRYTMAKDIKQYTVKKEY